MARVARLVRRIGALWAVVALAAGATPATATRWTVDHAGSGDFTTIQAALDQQAMEFRDTVLVMPGVYAETMVIPTGLPPGYLVGWAGAPATHVHSIMAPTGFGPMEQTRVEGFTFSGPVTQPGSRASCYLSRCVFLSSVTAYGHIQPPNFYDCDFYGRTTLFGYQGSTAPGGSRPPFQKLRFHGTTLAISPGDAGGCALVDCTFEGPADTLVMAGQDFDPITFLDCSFSNATYGIVIGFGGMMPRNVANCRFSDISAVAVLSDRQLGPFEIGHNATISVGGSRFERCGSAILLRTRGQGGTSEVNIYADTVLACRNDAVILVSVALARITNCIVSGSGGNGVSFLQSEADANWWQSPAITGSRFENNAGDGVLVQNSSEPDMFLIYEGTYSNCHFIGNGGSGLSLTGTRWNVQNCVALANGGDGFRCEALVPWGRRLMVSNTSAFNRGDGFRVSEMMAPGDSNQVLHRNLSALNAGAGFRVFGHALDSYAFNDAWGNYQGQHVGAWASLDSNLTVDPRFCDLGAGDLTLEQGSPCGPGGVYGLIGALPESCPNTLAVEPQPAGAIAFAVRPSVARGSVEFVPPATGGEGVVELFDIAGRVVWRAPLGPQTGTVRWHGEGEGGRVRAGLYWARFTNDAGPATRRLAWLE